jgi:hypothetical protein
VKNGKSCSSCVYVAKEFGGMECRRHAPAPVTYVLQPREGTEESGEGAMMLIDPAWPRVCVDDWCGEWMEGPTP